MHGQVPHLDSAFRQFFLTVVGKKFLQHVFWHFVYTLHSTHINSFADVNLQDVHADDQCTLRWLQVLGLALTHLLGI